MNAAASLRCGRFSLSLARPLLMGVLNVTPDSFSDGGAHLHPAAALRRAHEMVEEGVDIIDVGAESTRPGAPPVPEAEELRRLLPVLDALCGLPVPVSVDTRKPAVMHQALAAGASMINDINALRAPGAWEAVARGGCGVVLMHAQGDPVHMQDAPSYVDVVSEVAAFLQERVREGSGHGVSADRLVVDPGFGFGKTADHNLALLRGLPRLAGLGCPLLVGLSRKSVLGRITGSPATGRMAASVAAAVLAVQRGAGLVRVHDVRATRDALAVLSAVDGAERPSDGG